MPPGGSGQGGNNQITISSISPSAISVASPATQITINGSNFAQGLTINLNGSGIATTFVSSSQLTGIVPPERLALAATYNVTLTSSSLPNPPSASTSLRVTNLSPELDAFNPPFMPTGSNTTPLQVSGHNFTAASSIALNDSSLATNFDSATSLTAQVPSFLLSSDANYSLVVSNPAPGGGVSNRGQLVVSSTGDPVFDTPGQNQTEPLPADSLAFIEGPTLASPSIETVERTRTFSAASGTADDLFCVNPTINPFPGVCVKNVQWLSQIPPGEDTTAGWGNTKNCGLVSVLMAEDFISGVQLTSADVKRIIKAEIQYMKASNANVKPPDKLIFPSSTDDDYGANLDVGQIAEIAFHDGFQAATLQIENADVSANLASFLRTQLAAGHPVVVGVNTHLKLDPNDTDLTLSSKGHFMLVVGIDDQFVYVNDPGRSSQRKRPLYVYTRYTISSFTTAWFLNGSQTNQDKKRAHALVVSPRAEKAPLKIAGSSLSQTAPAVANQNYFGQFVAFGGQQPFVWSLTPLPQGMTFDQTLGILGGTPLQQGSSNFTVMVRDAAGNQVTTNGVIVVGSTAQPLQIASPQEIPPGAANTLYPGWILQAAGGLPNYTWSALGPLPNGLQLNSSGVIQGTISGSSGTALHELSSSPSAVSTLANDSFVQFDVQVTDNSNPPQTTTKHLVLHITPSLPAPIIASVIPTPETVSIGQMSNLTCSASDPNSSPLTFSWNVSAGTIKGSGSTVSWILPNQIGQYTATCTVTNAGAGSASDSTTVSVRNSAQSPLIAKINTNTGTTGVTLFTISGTGATANGGITATTVFPDLSTHNFHTMADGSGKYQFPSFKEQLAGAYSEIDSDDATQALSNKLTWNVQPNSLVSKINPQSGTSAITVFTVSGSGATPNGGITATTIFPDQSHHTFHATADNNGNYQFPPFKEQQAGTYSEVDTDDASQAQSDPFMWTVRSAVLTSMIRPNSGVAQTTSFTISGNGATPNGGVTATTTFPDQSTHTFHTMADPNGNYQFPSFTELRAGSYSEVDTDDATQVSSQAFPWTVQLNSIVNPLSGTVDSTMFTVSGSGATPNGGITATTTFPDTSTHTFHMMADNNGNYQFPSFSEHEVGTFTETDSDDVTRATSRQLSWTVQPGALIANINPTFGTAGITFFTVSGRGATPNSGITAVTTFPDHSSHTFHIVADPNGNYSFPAFTEQRAGGYSEVDTDDTTHISSAVFPWAVQMNSNVNPLSGNVGVTLFTISGSGATPNSGVTATTTFPDNSIHVFHVIADANGNYQFPSFKEQQSGAFSETDTDDVTHAAGKQLNWNVQP
jgi:hypothetical protein